MLPSTTAPPAVLLLAVASATIFLCCSIVTIKAQENIAPNIPPSLIECYNTSFFMNRDNRMPSTMESLITLIEKIENSDSFNMDIRQLAVALLHRFRQDGIERAPGIAPQPGVIPYSPVGFQFPKFRILLSRLIPGNAQQFPNSSLSREERCSMHFMLSSSFNMRQRGDENQVCNQLSQYRAQRLPRAAGAQSVKNNFLGDIEILESFASSNAKKRGISAKQFGIPQGVDYDYVDNVYDNSNSNNQVSQCPVEDGVIWTPWGAVSAGTVIAGIAAGLQPQQVQLRTLLALARRPGGTNLPQTATVSVDNRWAATLSGDLAEVSLVQVPATSTLQATVGANGAWNNTVTPRWYFLSQRQNLEMTDAEIRGGLDGLILAMNIANWRTQASSLKLSQLLRMYYSTDGVLGSGIMACNRKDQFPNVAPLNTMIAQTSAFAQVLNQEMKLLVTLEASSIATFSASASNALTAYIPQYLNDVSCSLSQPQDVTATITPMTNIYIFLDTSWQYNDVSNYVNYIVQRLNINPYASSVTMLGAQDGSIIVNTTNYISDYFRQWNVTTHSWYTPGFNLPNILRTVQNLTQTLLSGEKQNSTVGGRSLVALLIPNNAQISDSDSSFSVTRLQLINEQVPDLKFIYYAGGTTSRFSSFVQDPSQDIFPLSIGANAATASSPVVARIKKIPRRIINPRCGASWYAGSTGTDQMYQYARPGVTNYYRMAPNYFFGSGSGRYVNIQSQGAVQFTVCSSRSVALPSQNSSNSNVGGGSSSDVTCTQLTGNTYTYDISSACSGYSTIISCPPLYLSVQAPSVAAGAGLTTSCYDNACQTPDQARYTVSVVNLGCYSGVSGLLASFALVVVATLLRQFLQ